MYSKKSSFNLHYTYWINSFGQTFIVALILIGGGIKLVFYHKTRGVHTMQPYPSYPYGHVPAQVYLEIDEKKNP
ncbi:hypothetical protein SAMN04487897_11890 [Paenibacillus sp. yr247]|uniref:hypothetical protein n=1 Tax=Paenibacillus sp. yr247 TaxID=1761880 RepID=UPI00087F56CF|nr:hypothetical protein [Paenibacillus sp. yr247]SDO64173.1 hypothetical protein SAMN04487897_11890 [Paenibacillus sp. yr247]